MRLWTSILVILCTRVGGEVESETEAVDTAVGVSISSSLTVNGTSAPDESMNPHNQTSAATNEVAQTIDSATAMEDLSDTDFASFLKSDVAESTSEAGRASGFDTEESTFSKEVDSDTKFLDTTDVETRVLDTTVFDTETMINDGTLDDTTVRQDTVWQMSVTSSGLDESNTVLASDFPSYMTDEVDLNVGTDESIFDGDRALPTVLLTVGCAGAVILGLLA